MSDKNKALSDQSLPDAKTTRSKAKKKLEMALKIAGIALKLISIIKAIVRWFE